MFFGEAFSTTRGTGLTFLNPLCQLWPKYIAPGGGAAGCELGFLLVLVGGGGGGG